MTKKLYIIIPTLIIFIVASMLFIFKQNEDKETWVAYFAPSSTDVMYKEGNASLVEFNSDGKVKYFNTYAYPFSGLINFNNELIFQTKDGLAKLNKDIENQNVDLNEDTVGYTMAGNLNEDVYYFLCNGSFKTNYYSSKIIIGSKENNYIHEIKGFINSYGNDEDNIFLLTDDMTNRNNKQIQKISINNINDINIQSNNLVFDYEVESNFRMIVLNNYIYAFVIRDRNKISILKISKDSLSIENTLDLITFNSSSDGDSYYPISTNAIFFKDNKIYYPTLSGKVYSFDISTDNFIEEFTFKNYSMDNCLNPICYYDYKNSEIYLLYQEYIDNKYYLASYNLDGEQKCKICLKSLKLKNNLYAHNFIKKSS